MTLTRPISFLASAAVMPLTPLAVLALVVRIAAFKEVKPSQLALAWTIAQGGVPIPGIRRIPYVEENVATGEIALTESELAELGEAAPVGAATGDRYPAGQISTLTQRAARPNYLIGEPFHG
jgi:diketogulonate reductase-like aldo/keto reductase